MAEVQELFDFPPAPKLNVIGTLDASRATAAELRGELVFNGKGQCAACHPAPFYTDLLMHDLMVERFFTFRTVNNRAFFLNELDGFAANTGVVVIATTNHPEKLDPAILERPSRFDRKYTFTLPAPEERTAYIAHWNTTVEPALRLDFGDPA